MKIIHRWGRLFTPASISGTSARVKTLGQSNNVGSGSIAEFIANYAWRIGANTGDYSNVHIWSIAGQKWGKYNAQKNAQGFSGTSADSTAGYDVGFCYFWGLAEWWRRNKGPNEHLFLEKSGGVNQAMSYFLASDNGGSNNAFYRVANTVFIPAENALPAYQATLGRIAPVGQTLYLHNQGETEPQATTPNFAANLHQLIDLDLAPYWPSSAPGAQYLIWQTVDRPDINAQKLQYIATNSLAITSPFDQITVLTKDNVHWDTKSVWGAGFYLIPNAARWGTKQDLWLFKCHGEKATTTLDLFYDEGGWFNDFIPTQAAYKPAFTTATPSGLRALTAGSGAKTKLTQALRVQGSDGTEKTLVFVVEQPNTQYQNYVYTGTLSLIPGYQGGQIQVGSGFIGAAQSSVTTNLYVAEFSQVADSASTGNGLLTVYRNGVQLGQPVVAPLARVDGAQRGIALFSDLDEATPLQYASDVGTKISFVGGYSGVSAARRTAVTSELASLYMAGNPSPTTPTPTTPTVTTSYPTGPYAEARFAPRETGIYQDGSIWKYPIGMSGERTGRLDTYMPAGKSGAYGIQALNSSAFGGFIGLSRDPKRVASGGLYSLFLNVPDGVLGLAYNGVGASNTVPLILGRHYRLLRVGETGTVSVEQSTDETAVNWTQVYEFGQKTTEALYGGMDLGQNGSQLQNPRTQSMVPLNEPLPDGGILRLTPLGAIHSGGYADFGKTGIATASSQAFAAWGVFNLTQLTALSSLFNIAATADEDELFVTRVLDSGTLYSRVRKGSGSYSVPEQIAVGTSTDLFVLFEFDQNVCRQYVNGAQTEAPTGFVLPDIANFKNGLVAGGQKQADGTVQYGMNGVVRNVGFINRLTTAQEKASLYAAMGMPSALPAGTAAFSTLVRQYASDTQAPNGIVSANPVMVMDGLGY